MKEQDAANSQNSARVLSFAVALFLLLAAAQLGFSRVHFLDDAFIHLRIAHGLIDKGTFAYNEGLPGFSTSSPLYTTLTAAVSLVSRNPLVPKLVNLLIYAVLAALVAYRLPTCPDPLKATLSLGALGVLVSPFAVRWLTDGMETGSIMLASILLAVATDKIARGKASLSLRVGTVVLGAAAVLLRVEFGYILAVAIAALGARNLAAGGAKAGEGWRKAAVETAPFVLGGLLGSAVILVVFGHLLPDTAVAKQIHGDSPLAVLRTILLTHAGASLFGVGMLGLWMFSALVAYRVSTHEVRVYLLVANASMIVFCGLLIVTGQAIQGVRYFVFIESFLGALNILTLSGMGWRSPRLWQLGLLTAVFGAWFCYDLVIFYRISAGRSETYRRFAQVDYTYLSGHKGIAYDIGFVGYFTRGYILDPHGLVNGRAVARLTMAQRLSQYAREPVDFVFVNDRQRQEVQSYLDVSDWQDVGQFDFPNFSGHADTHWLLVRPGVVPGGTGIESRK